MSFKDETPLQCFERRRSWRLMDLRAAHQQLERSNARAHGEHHLGKVPLYDDDISEASIQEAIKRLNYASWEHRYVS